MTRKILIEIPGAGDVMCDKCPRLMPWLDCEIGFHLPVVWADNGGAILKRPQACLDAERLATAEEDVK